MDNVSVLVGDVTWRPWLKLLADAHAADGGCRLAEARAGPGPAGLEREPPLDEDTVRNRNQQIRVARLDRSIGQGEDDDRILARDRGANRHLDQVKLRGVLGHVNPEAGLTARHALVQRLDRRL